MRAVIERVTRARVVVDGQCVAQIGMGLLAYVAVSPDDRSADVEYLADKIAHLRIFEDAAGKMNLSLVDLLAASAPQRMPPGGQHEVQSAASEAGPGMLLVSAFTVLADARRGRRPSFDACAPRALAEALLEELAGALRARGLGVQTGQFGAHMVVECANDGPVCILLDSRGVV